MSKSNFAKLQRVQNTLARVVLRRGKYERITPALKELHWLPVAQRVDYKLASLVFGVKTTGQPQYLRDLLVDYVPVRILRSSTKNLICTDRPSSVLASRGFRASAAAVWNGLPEELRTVAEYDRFKRQLKTHLFKIAYAEAP
jgi:hypothetical protein